MQCMCAILSSVASPALQYFSTLSHEQRDFQGVWVCVIKSVLIFFTTFVETYLILRRTEQDIKNVYWSSYKISVILVRV